MAISIKQIQKANGKEELVNTHFIVIPSILIGYLHSTITTDAYIWEMLQKKQEFRVYDTITTASRFDIDAEMTQISIRISKKLDTMSRCR